MQSSVSFMPKITFDNLCRPINDLIIIPKFIWLFESGKCGTEGKKLQKNDYLENKTSVLGKIKRIFNNFKNAFF